MDEKGGSEVETSGGSRLGEKLRAARESKKRSPDRASHEAGVPLRYLRMLEEGRFPAVADPAYLTHFLRRYAVYLGLDAEDLARQFLAETEPETSARRTGKKPPEEATMADKKTAALPKHPLASRGMAYALIGLIGGAMIVAEARYQRVLTLVMGEPEPAPIQVAKAPAPAVPNPQPPAAAERPSIATSPPAGITAERPAAPPPAAAAPPAQAMAPAPAAPPPAAAAPPRAAAPAPPAAARASQPATAPANQQTALRQTQKEPSASSREGRFSPPYELKITSTVREVWVWISIDGGARLPVAIRDGETKTWKAQKGYVLSVDDAGGVRVSLNGEELPRLGAPGQARKNFTLPGSGSSGSEAAAG